jgi:hypothetical protein
LTGLVISQNEGQNNEDLLMWITEPGTEYYMHMYLWRNIPFSFKLNAMTEAVDITVRKTSTKKDTNCNSEENYNYIGKMNIRRVLTQYIVANTFLTFHGMAFTLIKCLMINNI